jgi:hypothetical protein
VSATGYPADADVRVIVKMLSSKGSKEVFKSKAVKSETGTVEYDANHENFKVNCAADAQFQVAVKDKKMFRDEDLGEGMFFVSDQGEGSEQAVKAGEGTVTIRSSFKRSESGTPAYAESLRPTTSNGQESPDSRKDGGHGHRRSFFGRRDASGKHENVTKE